MNRKRRTRALTMYHRTLETQLAPDCTSAQELQETNWGKACSRIAIAAAVLAASTVRMAAATDAAAVARTAAAAVRRNDSQALRDRHRDRFAHPANRRSRDPRRWSRSPRQDITTQRLRQRGRRDDLAHPEPGGARQQPEHGWILAGRAGGRPARPRTQSHPGAGERPAHRRLPAVLRRQQQFHGHLEHADHR